MIEPLLWNPLPAAAIWLTERTGRAFDARSLLDTLARMGKQGDPTTTQIKAALPRELNFATLAMPGHPMFAEATQNPATSARVVAECGPLPGGMAYLGPAYPRFDPLPVNSLLDLLVYGTTTIAVLTERENENQHERVWVMPWGNSHCATVETCGMNRADLLALGDTLEANTQPQAAPEPAPMVQTKEQRQDSRLKACEDAGLVMPKSSAGRLPDGVGKVADSKGVSRQAFSTDVRAALKRREAITKPGRIVHRT